MDLNDVLGAEEFGNATPATPEAENASTAVASEHSKPLDPPAAITNKQYASLPPSTPRRIHILGTGSIGKLIAHSLRGLPTPPPVTLLFHRYKLLEAWQRGKKEIVLQTNGVDVGRGGFDVELKPEITIQHGVVLEKSQADVYDTREQGILPHEAAKVLGQQAIERREQTPERRDALSGLGPNEEEEQQTLVRRRRPGARAGRGDWAESNEPIASLIVTTKAGITISALSAIRHRLTRETTICFLQNGMGVIDDVNTQLFPDEATRPSYVQGIITHGVNVPQGVAESNPFFAVHAGLGTLALGVVPRAPPSDNNEEAKDPDIDCPPTSRHLIRSLTASPVLCAAAFTPIELLQLQLEKLAVNSVLNPLTSLVDARNGAILYNFSLTRTMRLLLAETSLVLRSLPEIKHLPNTALRFSAERLERLVVGVANKTSENISSMLADVRNGRKTEIEYINGYIVKRGEEVGVRCVVNYAIMMTVVGKTMIVSREVRGEVPVEEGFTEEPKVQGRVERY